MRFLVTILLVTCCQAHIGASHAFDVGYCLSPEEPFPYKLTKSDPLYDAARDEHQAYLEELEVYVKCLDKERSAALRSFKSSFALFKQNFGSDAVFRYNDNQ